MADNCDVVGKVDNAAGPPSAFSQIIPVNQAAVASPSTLYCRVAPPIQTQVKLLGVYPLPWWDLQASATIQSLPGPEVTAIYPATNAEIHRRSGVIWLAASPPRMCLSSHPDPGLATG